MEGTVQMPKVFSDRKELIAALKVNRPKVKE
jgi:hypothetical protein